MHLAVANSAKISRPEMAFSRSIAANLGANTRNAGSWCVVCEGIATLIAGYPYFSHLILLHPNFAWAAILERHDKRRQ